MYHPFYYLTSQPQDFKSLIRGRHSRTVKSCALATTLSTFWVADGTTSSSTVKTLTTTSCSTLTGYSVAATTAKTTVSASTVSSSAGYVCGAGCGTGGCNVGVKRAVATPTGAATVDGKPTAVLEKRFLQHTGRINDPKKYVTCALSYFLGVFSIYEQKTHKRQVRD